MLAANHMIVLLALREVASAPDADLVVDAGEPFLLVLHRRAVKVAFQGRHDAVLSLIR